MRHAANSRAASNARLAFAIVNLPKVFKRCSVREAFFQADRSFDVCDREVQDIANCCVEAHASFRRQLGSNRKRADARAEQSLGGVDVAEAKHLRLIQ